MKNIKKVVATSVVFAGSLVGLSACGEVYVSFDKNSAGKYISEFVYEKDEFNEKLNSILAGLTKNGYKIEGVYLDKDFTKPLNFNESIKEDVTLFIKWVKADIEVAFDLNGGSGNAIPSQFIQYTSSAQIYVSPENLPTKLGYEFDSWNTNPDGTGVKYGNGQQLEMVGYEKVTLYAQYVAKKSKITYHSNFNEDEDEKAGLFDSQFTIGSCEFERKGYKFIGWNTKADGTGDEYKEGDIIPVNVLEIHLYAQWEAKEYSISYKKGNDEGVEGEDISGIKCKFDGSFKITDKEFSRDGYHFVGWKMNFGNENKVYTAGEEVDMNFDSNIELYPVWEVSNLPYDPNNINDLYVNFIYGDGESFDYAFVKGKEYSFKDATIEEIYGENSSNIAQISNNSLKVIGAGKFRIKLSRTSENNDIWYFNVVALNNEYSIEYQKEDGSVITANDRILPSEAGLKYTYGDKEKIYNAKKTGYTFKGWQLSEKAFIGGEWKTEGTYLNDLLEVDGEANTHKLLPASTIGNIKIKAIFEINKYELKFILPSGDEYNEYNDNEESFKTLKATYNTKWNNCTDFDKNALITNRVNAYNGYAFVGWYTHKTSWEDKYKFNGIVDSNKTLYARYIKLSEYMPKNLICSTGNIVSWEAPNIPFADSIKYYVNVDGKETCVESTMFEDPIIFGAVGTYNIEVRAKLTFKNSGIDFENSVETEPAQITHEITNLTIQSIISVRKDGELEKKIMFAGVEYKFIYNNSSNAFSIENVSEEGLVERTESILEDGKTEIILKIADNKVGTFTIVQNNNNTKIEVVPNITSISYGEAYSNYLSQFEEGSNSIYLDKKFESVSEMYQVGAKALDSESDSGYFKFDIKLSHTKNGEIVNVNEIFDFSNEEYSKFIFFVQNENGDWVDANSVYYNPETKHFSENADSGYYSCAVERLGEEFKFNSKMAGLSYRVEVYFAYTRSGNNPLNIEFNENGLDVSNLNDKLDFKFALNNGVNVYTSAELKSAYGNVSEDMVINIHNNIVAELDDHQMQDDGSPINVQSGLVFENYKTQIGKTDGNIFKRVSKDKENDKVVVNGNFCTIDASGIKLVPYNKYAPEGGEQNTSSSNGVNGQTGYQQSADGNNFVRPHCGVFRYQCPKNGLAIFNNLNILGNKTIENAPAQEEGESLENYDKRLSKWVTEYEQKNSGSLVGIYNECGEVIVNNTVITKTHHAVRFDTAISKDYESKLELNFVKVEYTYIDAIYSWNGKEAKVFNSYINNTGGLPVNIQDERSTHPTFIIDENTKIDNMFNGTEGWFVTWGNVSLAEQLKAELESQLNTFGASVLRSIGGVSNINPIFIYNPTDPDNLDHARGYYCTTITGGTKLLCPLNDERLQGYVYDEDGNKLCGYYIKNGVASQKNIDYITANPTGDPRVVTSLGYVFSRNDAVTAKEFNYLSDYLSRLISSGDLILSRDFKFVSGLRAWEAVQQLLENEGLSSISRDMEEMIVYYIYSQAYTCEYGSSIEEKIGYVIQNGIVNKDGLATFLKNEGMVNENDYENDVNKIKTKIDLVWNALTTEKTLASIHEKFATSAVGGLSLLKACLASVDQATSQVTIKSLIMNALIMQIEKYNVNATNPINLELITEEFVKNIASWVKNGDIENQINALSGDQKLIAEKISALMANEATLDSIDSNTYLSAENMKVIKGVKLTSIAEEGESGNVAMWITRQNPCAGVSDRNVANLIDTLGYLSTPYGSLNITKMEYLLAQIAQRNGINMESLEGQQKLSGLFGRYLLYSLGHKVEKNEYDLDILLEIVIPMKSNGSSTPMLMLVGSTMNVPLDPSMNS